MPNYNSSNLITSGDNPDDEYAVIAPGTNQIVIVNPKTGTQTPVGQAPATGGTGSPAPTTGTSSPSTGSTGGRPSGRPNNSGHIPPPPLDTFDDDVGASITDGIEGGIELTQGDLNQYSYILSITDHSPESQEVALRLVSEGYPTNITPDEYLSRFAWYKNNAEADQAAQSVVSKAGLLQKGKSTQTRHARQERDDHGQVIIGPEEASTVGEEIIAECSIYLTPGRDMGDRQTDRSLFYGCVQEKIGLLEGGLSASVFFGAASSATGLLMFPATAFWLSGSSAGRYLDAIGLNILEENQRILIPLLNGQLEVNINGETKFVSPLNEDYVFTILAEGGHINENGQLVNADGSIVDVRITYVDSAADWDVNMVWNEQQVVEDYLVEIRDIPPNYSESMDNINWYLNTEVPIIDNTAIEWADTALTYEAQLTDEDASVLLDFDDESHRRSIGVAEVFINNGYCQAAYQEYILRTRNMESPPDIETILGMSPEDYCA